MTSLRSDGVDHQEPSSSTPSISPAATESLARLLRALADPTRLRLLALIDTAPNSQATVGELTAQFDMTQPAISHHLKVLTEASVLHREKRGSWVWYRLNPQQLTAIECLVPGPQFLRSRHHGRPTVDHA